MDFATCEQTIRIHDNYFRLFCDFMDSGIKCAKIEGSAHKTPQSCATSLNRSAKMYHLYCVKARVHNGEVYLVNTSID